jgi:zinc and cadmium transporter
MTEAYVYSFISVTLISLVSLVGAFGLSMKEELLKKYTFIFISLAVGALLGDAFIHIIPEVFEGATNTLYTSMMIIAGVLCFFVLEKILHWHHHSEDSVNHTHPVGNLILFSDGVHNFIDGVIIAASYLVSIPVGIATTSAVILHEIPQEIGDFAVLLHAGYTKKRALWLNFLSALSAILGALFLFSINATEGIANSTMLPFASGGFIYVAMSDLIPELHKKKEPGHSISQIATVLCGILAMLALTLLE